MLKLLKYLKKNWISVLIIIILLCLQAWTDLTLPDYTSKIVNTGIQAGGIEYVSPTVIRKSEMDKLLLLTEDDSLILDNYTLISKSSLPKNKAGELKKEYPALEKEELYKLNKISKEERESLDKILAKPLATLYYMENQTQNMETTMETNNESSTSFDNEMIINQMATQKTKQEYKEIGMNLDKIQTDYIVKTGLQMIGIALLSMVAAVVIMLFSSRVAAYLGKILREKVFKKVLKFTRKEFNEFSTASLITRSTNDIQQIQMLIAMLFRTVVYAPIMGIGGFLKVLANSNNSMPWVIGVAIGAITFIIITLFIIAMPRFKRLQGLIDRLNLVSREILTGLPVIRAFNTEKREEKRFEKANKDLMSTNIFINRTMSIMFPSLIFVMNSIMLLIIWVGGHKVNEGIIQVGDMMAFIQYTMQIVISFLFISMLSIILPRASVSAKRINEVLDTEESIKDKEKDDLKDFVREKKGYVEFKNVSFRYPDADTEILEDINFTAKPGETTAIIGSTGSRKIYSSEPYPAFL